MSLRVGIDFSLASPALYAVNSKEEFFILCFQQRKTDQPIVRQKVQEGVWLWRLSYPLEENCRWKKVIYITDQVFKWMDAIREHASVVVFIENYAFGGGSFGSSSVTKLAELGGVLRAELCRRHWPFHELAITSIKKHFAGHGNAEKCEIACTYRTLRFPNVQPLLECEYHQHPLEDVVDAAAILMTGLHAT